TAAERRPASRTSMDRSHRAETPGSAAGGPAPGGAGARRRRQGRNAAGIKARSGRRVRIGDAAAMSGVMHPYAAREGGAAAGSERISAGIDGDDVMPPIDPAPAP